MVVYMDGCMSFHVCGWLCAISCVWMTVCMDHCLHGCLCTQDQNQKFSWFYNSTFAKNFPFWPCVCMQPYTQWYIHIVIHTCKNACTDPLTQKYTPPSMHTSMCMATWMDVYVNQANSWTAPAKPKYVHEYHKKFFKFSISFIIYLCYCLASKSKNTKKKWQTSGQQCSNYTKICR